MKRRQRPPERSELAMLVARWRNSRLPRDAARLAALERGECVTLSVDELPDRGGYASDAPCIGDPDDLELSPDGELKVSVAYYRRRIEAPLTPWVHASGDGRRPDR